MLTLRNLAVLGVFLGVLGFSGAEAAPLPATHTQASPEVAQLNPVQYRRGGEPDWYYGPKWGGYRSGPYYGPAYRYYVPPAYRAEPRWYYGPRWGGYSPGPYYGRGYGYYGPPAYRAEPHWYYGPKWSGFGW